VGLPQIIQGKPPSLPEAIQGFLNSIDFYHKVDKLLKNSSHLTSFYKQFYDWFDYFMVLKLIHFSRDHFHPNISLDAGLSQLNKDYWKIASFDTLKPQDQLIEIRKLNRVPNLSM
jgi:hypothetical protein